MEKAFVPASQLSCEKEEQMNERNAEVRGHRNYKDTVFRMLFKDKSALLSLYNAMTGSNHSNVDDL